MLFTDLVHVLDPEPHSAALNMAIDEVLLQRADAPLLRVYRWERPALSFGYFGRIAAVEESSGDRALVRRWTGGGSVEHGEDVTYTLIVPRPHPFAKVVALESYRQTHEAVRKMLSAEGMQVQLAPVHEGPASGACFVSPVRYDLMAGERKIAGAAQRRTRWGLLHQGSIQMDCAVDDADAKLAGAMSETVRSRELSSDIIDAAIDLAKTKYGTTAWLRKF